ncbi:uncharacterized protein LOC134543210 [Bacillus rossius redtenbacheri]|uniref:uncharacterized protein LOC134543210 n=1 Tax=Bacillus rossius redtenbacheri TaxID=93214 RepID=UPI002FDD1AFF
MLPLLLALLVPGPATAALQADVSSMALQYFALKGARLISVFACRVQDTHHLMRSAPGWVLAPHDMDPRQPQQPLSQAVLLDHSCPRNRLLLQQNANRGLLNGSHFWLVWAEDADSRHDVHWRLRLDSDVTWAWRASPGLLLLLELYSTGEGGRVLESPAGNWSTEHGLHYLLSGYKYLRRRDMLGQRVRAAIVPNTALHDPQRDLLRPETRLVDAMAAYNYHIFLLLRSLFNFTLDMLVADKFGIVVEGGPYEGVVQMLHEGTIDTAISTFVFVRDRMKYIDYSSAYSWRFRWCQVELRGAVKAETGGCRWFHVMCAVFRHPPVSGGTDALVRPFSGTLWLAMFALWLLIAGVLRFVAWLQPRYVHVTGETQDDIPSSSDLFLLVVGIVGEQGTWLDSRWLAWRLVLLIMLLLTVLLNTYYAANVVSTLLNQAPYTIRTAHDLVDSALRFAAEDVVYSRSYFQITNNSLIRELYTRKMAPHGDHYVSMEEGLRRVMTQGFAFHMEDVRAYWAIQSTFPDELKCDLREVELFPGEMGYYVYPFGSAFKEAFTYGMRRVVEAGLWDHENTRSRPPRPGCPSQGAQVASVDLASLAPAFGLVAAGCAAGLLLLLAELARGPPLALR